MFDRFLTAAALIGLMFTPATAQASAMPPAACQAPAAGHAGCFAQIWAKTGQIKPLVAPAGYSPAQLRAAYKATTNAGGKIAVVDAYDDPGIAADLTTYSKQFGLSVLPSCGTATQTGCFEKLSQTGTRTYPAANSDWALETALDTEVAHAMCPDCRLELIEAKTDSITNLLTAVNEAVATGAPVVSMSWGGSETSSEVSNDAHFKHSGVTFLASSGDSGYGVSWPAASPEVMAIGGTHLPLSSSGARATTETVWTGTGSGCSRYEAKPAWQTDPGCANRTVADLAADADPSTGAAVYTSLSSDGAGWYEVGGTSLAAPLVAGLVADSKASGQATVMAKLYGSLGTSRLHDVKSGSTGSCSPSYLCKAIAGYDGPSGVGSPAALTAF